MQTAVEISLYPLRDNYLEVIKWFIARIDNYPQIRRSTNGMSTQLQGEHAELMQFISLEMANAYDRFGRSVFVCKFIPGGVDLDYSDEGSAG